MRERPILFSSPMVRAILRDENPKTQTRRVIKPQPFLAIDGKWYQEAPGSYPQEHKYWKCPYGQPGDRLWVRERFQIRTPFTGDLASDISNPHVLYYADDNERYRDRDKWKPSIHMPRWASRITLEITGVRVERIQDMNFYDWAADFCPSKLEQERALASFVGQKNMVDMAKTFWDSINAKRGFGWDTNPWVWVIEFKRVEDERRKP